MKSKTYDIEKTPERKFLLQVRKQAPITLDFSFKTGLKFLKENNFHL